MDLLAYIRTCGEMGARRTYEMRLEEEREKRIVAQDKAREFIMKRHSAAMKEFQGGTMEVVNMTCKAATVRLVTKEEFRKKQKYLK